jgi:hypothetical protein
MPLLALQENAGNDGRARLHGLLRRGRNISVRIFLVFGEHLDLP